MTDSINHATVRRLSRIAACGWIIISEKAGRERMHHQSDPSFGDNDTLAWIVSARYLPATSTPEPRGNTCIG